MGITPLAEFVDGPLTAQWLCDNGCFYGQGEYLGLARPVSVLEQHRARLVGRGPGQRRWTDTEPSSSVA